MTMVFIQTIASFIASCGFGIIFNIKGKKLFFAAIGGGLSWFVYALGLYLFHLYALVYILKYLLGY